ncbi:2,3-diaminopropionate biosynthesis protein SbnB [Amycolatopsis coloradensis]|uniref:2,3-diaminopropionate biosynthesis protein SbnB n=1 Tax=Amycolatopsis coloradensis TaxID=76021 RepID=A0A1R0KDP5_9PSEU|nr:2,3-diaminopropionate biosynthesis protein SbnB [Amycolatopsis coloradensis]OLZ43065.1 2,3-diaminopropionate biosynthesis protein SbnB [Amycolatopsis coloradensis]
MLILSHGDVRRVLDGAEHEVLAAVRAAYVLHAQGRTAVPHSVFLRFPGDERNRIIALPAFLDTPEAPVAGVKWVSSFPGNVAEGLDRASAAIILNSMRTGHPEVFIEGATISARRTAASAAVAAATLGTSGSGVSLVGCGVINFEVLTFLRTLYPEWDSVTLFDLDQARASAFADRCAARWPDTKVDVVARIEDAVAAHPLVCLATSATVPHLDASRCRPGSLILHLSLRDLTPETILSSVNVVDDADHVCRAATSLHLAERQAGHRDFIAHSLGELLLADGQRSPNTDALTVFSPFGLGALDLALADLVHRRARELGLGTRVPDFLGTVSA